MTATPTWLVLGASSAVARAFAMEAARRGRDVLLAGRDLDDLGRTAADIQIRTGRRAEVLAFDARAFADHAAFVERCRALGGPLSVFLAFADMPAQDAIDRDPALGLRTIETGFLGAVSVLSHLAPVLEAQRTGAVVVLGSVAGDRGRIGNYTYGAAKAGLHAYLQGLRARLFRSGVGVTTVKPGFLDTAMTWGMPGLFLVASPGRCARSCLRWAERGREVGYFPAHWLAIMTVIRLIPERLFKRLTI